MSTSTTEPESEFDQITYGSMVTSDQWPVRVIMPDVNIELQLTGSVEQDGVWDISETGANFAINSAVPNGKAGNTVLFGHDRPNLFRRIHDLTPGQEVRVIIAGKAYVYAMTSSEVVTPTEVRVFEQTVQPKLTLITCDGWTSADRYIVHASLVRIDE